MKENLKGFFTILVVKQNCLLDAFSAKKVEVQDFLETFSSLWNLSLELCLVAALGTIEGYWEHQKEGRCSQPNCPWITLQQCQST